MNCTYRVLIFLACYLALLVQWVTCLTINDYITDKMGNQHLLNFPGILSQYLNTRDETGVHFWLYTRKNPINHEELFINLQSTKNKLLKNRRYKLKQRSTEIYMTNYMPDKPVVMITHGWTGDARSESVQMIKNALLLVYDYNVIAVDWGAIAKDEYIRASHHVETVGKEVCDMVRTLHRQYSLQGSMVHLIGFSLGAHVMGRAGAALKAHDLMVSRITGLDPAGPLFKDYSLKGLTEADADFVDAIHTNAGVAGLWGRRGHADFYPNGGAIQPSCLLRPASCHHKCSYKYFANSILGTDYKSKRCIGYLQFLMGFCANNEVAYMGYPCSREARGTFYLKT